MKKHIIQFFASVILSASAFAYTEPTGTCLTWFGYNALDGASGDYSVFLGSYSGKYGSTLDYGSFLGVMSGAYSSNLKSCNAMGYYAMANAYDNSYVLALGPHAGQTSYDNYDCVFIGRNAGRGANGCTNCVFIGKNAGVGMAMAAGAVVVGDVLVHTNGATTVKGLVDINQTIDSYGLVPDAKKTYDFIIRICDQKLYDTSPNGLYGISWDDLTDYLHISGPVDFSNAINIDFDHFVDSTTRKDLNERLDAKLDREEVDSVCHKSLTIEDEDTGEKYIIKVKSGALKLYKVEEDNANGPLSNAPNGNGGNDEQE